MTKSMKLRRAPGLMILVASILCGAVGCENAAKIGINKALQIAAGPKGKCFEIQGLAPGTGLARYKKVEIARFENELGFLVPPDYPDAIIEHFIRRTRDLKTSDENGAPRVFTSASKQTPDKGKGDILLVRGRIIHYDKGDKMKRSIEQGGDAVLIARVELVDKATDKRLAALNVRGVVKEGSARGVAEGVAKGLAKYIAGHTK